MTREQQSRELLEHPLIKEFFEEGIKKIYDAWISSKNTEEREQLFLFKEAFDSFYDFFKRNIEEGEAKIPLKKHKEKRFGIF